MTLETLEPNPVWVAEAYNDTIEILEAHSARIRYKIWGADWCKDCRATLPDFGAALDAADVPNSHIEVFEVDQNKQGPKVAEYEIERIPTVVAERGGEEIARFVESESTPIAVYLADRIADEVGDPTR